MNSKTGILVPCEIVKCPERTVVGHGWTVVDQMGNARFSTSFTQEELVELKVEHIDTMYLVIMNHLIH